MQEHTQQAPFPVSLALSAHHQAQQFQRYHGKTANGRQVYLNTLAVSAVNFYLDCLNIDTDISASSSWDPVQQTLLATAELVLPRYGKVECCPVLPGAVALSIPPEATGDRLAYLAVQLSESLREAQILGYAAATATGAIALDQLQPLDDFPAYLRRCATEPVQLGRWLQGFVDTGWQAVETLLDMADPPQMAAAFRGTADTAAPMVVRRKPLTLATQSPVQLQLLVGLRPLAGGEVDVYVQVVSVEEELPPGLALTVFDEADAAVMTAQSQGGEAMQLQFGAMLGERFSIRLALAAASVTERFVV